MPKPRDFSPQFRFRVVLEIVSGQKSLAEVSREHKIKDSLLHRWEAEFLESGRQIFVRGSPA